MPPKTKITRDMVAQAALDAARQGGLDAVSARTVAARLGCSTQPVMYCFRTIAELKQAVFDLADRFHTAYLLNVSPDRDPLTGIGLNYVRFAVEEPQLFRILFQSGLADGRDLPGLLEEEALRPILSAISTEAGTGPDRAREIFLTLAMFVHGYASLLANNAMNYDEEQLSVWLERLFSGAVLAAEKQKEDTP